ncbi:hypothetical protein GFM14_09150 [Rhizobium leguminosarum bv. viciae]|uniref:hypothetical protein n=1 Tax=Rhizobium leguminosarum TaxID=384 RepID=UPI001441C2D4|nr:hypothetical protein [Rhizobium leguminosarum]NKJ91778.1 hypothetical protein [Rhizobium leguminosarum bv. viciae]
MFEVGKNYEFHMIEGGSETEFQGVIESYEHPLIKLKDSKPLTIQFVGSMATEEVTTPSYPGKIINVTSTHFISAVRKD